MTDEELIKELRLKNELRWITPPIDTQAILQAALTKASELLLETVINDNVSIAEAHRILNIIVEKKREMGDL